jgi:DNA-binding MarR family transcriptional regulator
MSVKPTVFPLGDKGPVLATRSLGAEVAGELRRVFDESHVVIVDFRGGEVASSPFLDELAKAVRTGITDHPGSIVVLANYNEDIQDTLELVLERRGMALTGLNDKKLQVLGGKKHLEETLAEAQRLGTFTATELAERLKLKVPNLHQRLTQLQAAGAITSKPDPASARPRVVFATARAEDLEAALC